MNEQVFRDSQQRIIGRIEQRHDGSWVARDAGYRVVGYYDPVANLTRDASWRIVGNGNQLTSLFGTGGR
ncbi:MAG TPA: hypothetical protein VFW49_00540 [Fluviicoccus sp.]|nr:hypothetical protein [Fluviicoccus sp.]